MSIKNVAFIGLGVMGYPMAGHLVKAGYQVTVYNRTQSKAQQWCEQFGGQCAQTPREASQHAQVVFVCVGNDEDVRSVVLGQDGILQGALDESIIVDHTTTSAQLAIALSAEVKPRNIQFVDAPVSGGQAGAENGVLTVMCGGDPAAFQRVQPVMNAYSKHMQLMGAVGQGQRCKMVNQICITGVLQGLSEALLLAQASGLDIPQVVQTLQHGAAGSWQMENRMTTMAKDKFDFGFAIDWMRKDLGICKEEAARHGLHLQGVESADAHYASLQQEGYARMDTSAIVKSIQRASS